MGGAGAVLCGPGALSQPPDPGGDRVRQAVGTGHFPGRVPDAGKRRGLFRRNGKRRHRIQRRNGDHSGGCAEERGAGGISDISLLKLIQVVSKQVILFSQKGVGRLFHLLVPIDLAGISGYNNSRFIYLLEIIFAFPAVTGKER